jgi:hypothetical protein
MTRRAVEIILSVLVTIFIVIEGFFLYRINFKRSKIHILPTNIYKGKEKNVPDIPITYTSQSDLYGFTVKDPKLLASFLNEHKFWQNVIWQIPSGPILNGQVKLLKIVYTNIPQPYNTEETSKGIIGSVNITLENGIMTITIQSDPQKIISSTPSWHVETLFLRIINDLVPTNPITTNFDLYQKYKILAPIFDIYE